MNVEYNYKIRTKMEKFAIELIFRILIYQLYAFDENKKKNFLYNEKMFYRIIFRVGTSGFRS